MSRIGASAKLALLDQLGRRSLMRRTIGIGMSFGGGSRSVTPDRASLRIAASISGLPVDETS